MNGSANTTASPRVKAIYSSPTTTDTFEKTLISSNQNTEGSSSKVVYLHSLRTSTKQLQNDLNQFLTAKMEEDKATAATSTSTNFHSQASKAPDEEEEENYGEEKIDED